jgi:Fe-Mn family superoxide dismutase
MLGDLTNRNLKNTLRSPVKMAHTLPELPYAQDALAPVISAETISYHYGKHHQGYVNKLNAATEGTKWADASLEDIITSDEKGLFNNAAQVWNHTFYWNCMSPNGGGDPSGAIAAAIDKSFGGFADFKEKFSTAAAKQFGSGWAWVVKTDDGIAIETTSNADTPVAHGKTAVLTLDVWEHAYYVDYRNARAKYIEEFWKLVNWDFLNKQLG